jgi:proteic killer suppression protein
MIKSFAHKGLEKFFQTGSKAGICPDHATRLTRQLATLNVALCAKDMDFPGWDLHPLKGDMAGFWDITVNANWRLTFRFVGEDVEIVDYQDYH